MSINRKKIEEIRNLSSPERISGYLFYSAKLAMLGARIRKNNRPDESWAPEEEKEWDDICNELDPWFYALSREERMALDKIEVFMAKLTCAESVLEDDPSRGYQVNKHEN